MAEPVVFGGSPLDQYLQDAEADPRQVQPADQASDQVQKDPLRPESIPDTHAASETATTPAVSSPPSQASISPEHSALKTNSDPDTTCDAAETDRDAASPARKEGHNTLRSASSYSDLSSQLIEIFRALVERLLLPLVLILAQQLSKVIRQPNSAPMHKPKQRVDNESTKRNRVANDEAASFSEKFKYAICSSFLLTPSLSISFYDSSPPFETQSATADISIGRQADHVGGDRASASPIIKQCYAEPADGTAMPVVPGMSAESSSIQRLPRLDLHGRTARNAALVSAIFLLPPISKSLQAWFSTTILIAGLTWGYILLFDHSSLDEKLSFTLSREAAADASARATSLRNLSTTDQLSSAERTALQRSVIADVQSLIRAAQHFDLSVNKAISAIQEVEIVSRGYKLTHPLPPISRIEAASAQPSALNSVASPSRHRRSMIFAPATGKLARSLSGGGSGAPTIKRHAQRPLSLNLSNGRASPLDRAVGRAVSSDMGDLDLTQKLLAEQTTVATAASRPATQRLVELRKSIVMALEDAGAACTTTIASLELLADPEEVAVLHELYALDETPSDENNEADVSHAWSTGDASFTGSPELDHDRKNWVATTPRNFGSNVRSADVSGGFWSEMDTSPRIGSKGHKRLSLVSDAGSVLDRPPRATSSLSRRSSLVSESGNISAYRSPRFNYVSDRSNAASGPNESAAAKRLSYISNSSAATGSIDTRSPKMRQPSITSSTFTPPSAQTFSAATSPQSRATKRSSILGPNSIFANLDASIADASRAEPADPLSLLSIKAKFESMHRTRRRWLCRLLALRTSLSGDVPLSDGSRLPADEYWSAARSAISSLTSMFGAKEKAVSECVAKEMGTGLFDGLRSESMTWSADKATRSASRQGLLGVPSATNNSLSIAGHPELEDRLEAMMLSLRSLQSKIRVCAEDIHVKAPAGLHGIENSEASKGLQETGANSAPSNDVDDATSIVQLEKTLESMRDDLLGLSAEWEASVKLVNKHKRRTPSPLPSSDVDSDAVKSSAAARDLESPLEADEDAAGSSQANADGRAQLIEAASDADLLASSGKLAGEVGEDDDDDDDSDLAELLMRSTSPNSLPPPGLEQVFESIAGLAGMPGLGMDGKKASRAERIEQARRQRQAAQEKQASDKAAHRHTMDPFGIMLELSDVIQTRKAVREQRHRSALSPAAALDGFAPIEPPSRSEPIAQPALALGSPLDLGSAEQEGVFGGAHSFVDSQAGPRRSLSSLDLARARALQTLEARSPSVASSLGSNSFESEDESQSRMSDEFSFEPTALESVPEDDAGTSNAGWVLPNGSPSVNWDSTSRKTTPKASLASLAASGKDDATPVPDSPFDLGAQVAAYARRKAAAKAQAAATAVQRSQSDQGVPSPLMY